MKLRLAIALSLSCSLACGDDAPNDEGAFDAGRGALDAGRGARDAGVALDAGDAPGQPQPDAAVDAGGGGCEPFVPPSDCFDESGDFVHPPDGVLPTELRCTGLYGNWEAREPACGVRSYKPAYELWSDAALKRRWLSLPEGTTIDASDRDGFVFPVGTQLFKEFRIPDGQGGTRIGETRLLRKLSEDDWLYTTYVWNEEGTRAVQENAGVADLFGLGHIVPSRDDCQTCHQGRADFVLGFDPVLLGEGAEGLTIESLVAQGLLTAQDAQPTALAIPGTEVERAALGYLHVNCGVSCHNERVQADANDTQMFTRLDADTLGSVSETLAFNTAINKVPSDKIPAEYQASGPFIVIRPLDPEGSLLFVRMTERDAGKKQMPQLGTNEVDEVGIAAVRAWIEAMTEEGGYPGPATP